MAHPSTWLRVLPQGLYCEPGGFFIDPTRAVDRAVITHAHSDHARPGHRAVLANPDTLALMLARLGEGRAGETQQALGWGEKIDLGGVRLWLEPAGHVLGSAQVAMEFDGAPRRCQRRLQAHRGSDLRGFRAGSVRRVRDRGDIRAAGVPPSAAGAGNQHGCSPAWRCFRSGRTWLAATRWENPSG